MPSATTPPPGADPSPPSPSPAPPLAAAPGPRAQALINIYTSALSATLRKCSPANFASCFPTPAAYVPENLDALHRDFVGRLEESCQGNFERILQERDVVRGLNGLDWVLEEGKRREGKEGAAEPPEPLHMRSPETLWHAHLHPMMVEHVGSVKAQIETLQEGNKELFGEVRAQREEIARLVEGLELVVKELEGAAGMVEGDGVAVLEGEVRAVEEGLKG